jgi:phage terminase small subunit
VFGAGYSEDSDEGEGSEGEEDEEVAGEMRTLMQQMDSELAVTEVGRSFEKTADPHVSAVR